MVISANHTRKHLPNKITLTVTKRITIKDIDKILEIYTIHISMLLMVGLKIIISIPNRRIIMRTSLFRNKFPLPLHPPLLTRTVSFLLQGILLFTLRRRSDTAVSIRTLIHPTTPLDGLEDIPLRDPPWTSSTATFMLVITNLSL